jgi:hypothetical protein
MDYPGVSGARDPGGPVVVNLGGFLGQAIAAQEHAREVREYVDQVAAAVTTVIGCPVSVVVHRSGRWANLVIEAEPGDDIHLPSAVPIPGQPAVLVWTCPEYGKDPVGWSWDTSTRDTPTASLVLLLAADGAGLGPDAAPDEVAAAVAAANDRKDRQ